MPAKMSAEWHREYRQRRRAAGRPLRSGSKTWAADKRAAWEARYYTPEMLAHKAKQMRGSAARHPDRHSARRAVRTAIESGRLTRGVCEVCASPNAHAHHDDYGKPLDVRWFCRMHHDEHHTKARGGS